MYHGQGSILHPSGVTYEGMWINGRPAGEGQPNYACSSVLSTGIAGNIGSKKIWQFGP